MNNKKITEYVSLEEATKYCPYSQEYLSLRARQGKLRAIKIGRNWVTKREWLKEYLAEVEEYNNLKTERIKELIKVKREVLPARRSLGEGRPPENLPIGEIKLVKVKPFYTQIIDAITSPEFRFGAVFLITLTLIITGAFLEKDSFKEVATVISAPIKESFVSVYEDIENEFSTLGRKINEDEIYSAAIYGTIDTYQEYFEWLGKSLGEQISKVENSAPVLVVGKTAKNVWNVAKTGYTVADNFIEENISVVVDNVYKLSQDVAFLREKMKFSGKMTAKEEGLVVIPSTEKDEEVKEKIKAAFSDEVEVKPKDRASGIIVPIFRERKGEDYMYILVPINPIKE